jgi:hypothetical protein
MIAVYGLWLLCVGGGHDAFSSSGTFPFWSTSHM